MFFDQRRKGHVRSESARKRYSRLLQILDESNVSEQEYQNQEKWQNAETRHLERFQTNDSA